MLDAKHWLYMASVMLHMEAQARRLDRVSQSHYQFTSTSPTRDSNSGPGHHCARLTGGENGLRHF